jgi:hypothetical protein
MNTQLNPYFLADPTSGVAAFPARRPLATTARLPQAPRTGSPVPELTSLWHDDDPGTWGQRSYPGNCSGTLIHALLRFYSPRRTYDPMSGSGTCAEVCTDLGIDCWSGDIHHGQDACEPPPASERFDFVWLHPPYWRQKLYASDPRDLSREPTLEGFLARYAQLLRASAVALEPGGRLAVLMGDYQDREAGFVPLVFWTKRLAFEAGLVQCATDIVRFSHGASSGRKTYRSSFIPGLHDICCLFQKPHAEGVQP